MNSDTISAMTFYNEFRDLVAEQSEWSQSTFGSDQKRSCLGALKHLEKEAKEAQEAFVLSEANGKADLHEEIADCFLLILDASRRSGLIPMDLVRLAQRKMAINKTRTWPTPVDDQPVEHVR